MARMYLEMSERNEEWPPSIENFPLAFSFTFSNCRQSAIQSKKGNFTINEGPTSRTIAFQPSHTFCWNRIFTATFRLKLAKLTLPKMSRIGTSNPHFFHQLNLYLDRNQLINSIRMHWLTWRTVFTSRLCHHRCAFLRVARGA